MNGSVDSSSSGVVALAAPLPAEDSESLSFGTMWEQPTLTHLELCSIDSLTDSDWASLLSDLNPQRLITLDLQGVFLGDRAVAMLARTGNISDLLDSSSPPHSPTSESSAFGSSPPSAPPSFFSSSSPLHLQSLRLSCSALSHKGVGHLQEFFSRLIHLSVISLHGFRKVTSENWIDIMARIEFRWIEVIDIMSSGYDDACARYLGERLRAREQTLETAVITVRSSEEVNEPKLPTYSAQIVAAEPSSSSTTTAIPNSSSSITLRMSRRMSLSSRLFSTVTPSSTASSTAIDLNTKQKTKDTDKMSPTLSTTATSAIRPNPSQKYLEIDLRYTDITTNGLMLLRRSTIGQAKKVVVRSRDGEDEDEVDEEGMDEIARLTAKLMDDGEHEDNLKSNGKGRAVPLSPTFGSNGGLHPGTGSANSHTLSSSSPYGPGNGSAIGGGSNNTRASQSQQPSRSSTFTKLKGAFKKR
ncbi:hypothetical protein EDD21DRAFT_369724 [Dissophora ornata]|nr:hypothetical protein EDD21DRAFT_369724 [Dissophora ornata]